MGHPIIPEYVVYALSNEYGYTINRSRIYRLGMFKRGVAVTVYRFFPPERTIIQDKRRDKDGLLELTLEEAIAATLISSNDALQEYYRQISDSRPNQPTESEHVP